MTRPVVNGTPPTSVTRTTHSVRSGLTSLGCTVLPSASNFVLVKPPLAASDVVSALRDRGILVRFFDLDRVREYFRVTIGTEEEMSEFLDAMRDILAT